jgi:hypothetical protein
MSRGIKWPSSVRHSKEVPRPWRRNGLSKDLSEEHARCRPAGAGAVCRTPFSGGKPEIGRGNANAAESLRPPAFRKNYSGMRLALDEVRRLSRAIS